MAARGGLLTSETGTQAARSVITPCVTPGADILPDDIDAVRAALLAERTARHEAEVRATGAEAMPLARPVAAAA